MYCSVVNGRYQKSKMVNVKMVGVVTWKLPNHFYIGQFCTEEHRPIATSNKFNGHFQPMSATLSLRKHPLNKWTHEKTIKSWFLWNGFNNYSFINDLCWYFICLYPGIFKTFGNKLRQDPSMDDRVKLLDRPVWWSRTNFQSRLLTVGMEGKCRVDWN